MPFSSTTAEACAFEAQALKPSGGGAPLEARVNCLRRHAYYKKQTEEQMEFE